MDNIPGQINQSPGKVWADEILENLKSKKNSVKKEKDNNTCSGSCKCKNKCSNCQCK